MSAPLRDIPPVHRLTTDPAVAAYDALLGRGNVRSAVQAILDRARDDAALGAPIPAYEQLRGAVLERLAQEHRADLVGVINGTGVLLHTNFGRAPIAPSALANAARLGAGYTNLEYDLDGGKRGSRYDRVALQLCELSGAEAALVVNNCAAAVLLVLDTFARDRDVVVSRGQLIEIGGGFRLPDVLRKSGANLVEVGTTNKTYPHDYRNAWSGRTAMFMRSHPSNYRIEGFTAEVDAKTLAALAHELEVIAFEDLGSGALVDFERFGLPHEPTVAEEIAAGMDLVAVSGDKLLGGPQCGILCGKAGLIAMVKRNPLLRALRVDKLTLGALSATLALYLEPDRLSEIPLFAMLQIPIAELRERAQRICDAVRPDTPLRFAVCETEATTGGGTLPLAQIRSAGICIAGASAQDIAAKLRDAVPPVVGRVEESGYVIDLRTVSREEDPQLIQALGALR
jgi:L-seryl-tRNA(Ser) seleniumtransferase